LADHPQAELGFMTEANTARVERQKRTPITVVIGNPPYNVGQMAYNDRNQNRTYESIDQRVRETYGAASAATSVSKLNDPYVKFFRWATDRLGERDGIVCFISNNSFVEQFAFDGMRKHLLEDFTVIYHFDLEGNVRQNPTLSGTQYNVFGIQVGVGVTIAIRTGRHKKPVLYYSGVDKALRRADKLRALASHGAASTVPWQRLSPDARHTWLVPAGAEEFAAFLAIGNKVARAERGAPADVIFKAYSLGVATHRDRIAYGFSREGLIERVGAFIDAYNTEVDRWKRAPQGANVDEYVKYDTVVWDRDLKKDLQRGRYVHFSLASVRAAMYRPFSK
jgi:predicted helicase